jgi:hypothetical protein
MNEFIDSTNFTFEDSIAYKPGLLGDFIAQEIEFLLPDVIQSLQIPVVPDAGAKRRLEYSLKGAKGFRAIKKKARNKAVDKLKAIAFADALRVVQKTMWTRSQANSSNLVVLRDLPEMERTTSEPPLWSLTVANEPRYEVPTPTTEEVLESSKAYDTVAATVTKAVAPERITDVALPPEKERLQLFDVPKIPIELQEPIVGRDIRGLIALLRRGKIVAFVEEVAGQLVSEDVEKIEIPNKKVFAKLDLAGLIAEYHALSSIENLHENAQRLKEFRLIDALLVAVENDEQWSRINARRFHLITKKYTLSLSSDENSELERLDQLAERQMYSALELPFAELAMVEAYAASVGLTQTAA